MNKDILKAIKDELNEKLKLIKIEFKGIRGTEKLINITKILKEYGGGDLLPDVEQFNLFDFNRIREGVRVFGHGTDEELQEVDKFEKIYNEYEKFINSVRDCEKILRDWYVIDSLCGVSLVYTDEIPKIEELSKKIQNEEKQLNLENLKEMLQYCTGCLATTIRYELAQRGVEDLTEDLTNSINKKIKNISDIHKIIGNIGLKYDYVFDISDEMLSDPNIVHDMKRKISDDKLIDLIDKYYSIKSNG